MALAQPEPYAALEEESPLCESAGYPDTYRLRCCSSTVADAICALDHERDATSSAYCVRDHPHDACVLVCIKQEALEMAVKQFAQRMQMFKIRKGVTEEECTVICPGFLEARVLRRALLTLVHTMACSSVRISKNTSDHEDWIIAHRCGQLAIVGDGIESTASLRVCGRNALGRDLHFQTDEAVSPANLDAPLVEMRGNQEIHADLYFTRGTPMEHAKHHCVVSPSYSPEVIFSRALTREQKKKLHEYSISRKNVCTRIDGRQCRAEVLRELVPEGLPEIVLGGKVTVGVESLGQMPAVACVQRALRAVLEESDVVCRAITECGMASLAQAAVGTTAE